MTLGRDFGAGFQVVAAGCSRFPGRAFIGACKRVLWLQSLCPCRGVRHTADGEDPLPFGRENRNIQDPKILDYETLKSESLQRQVLKP